MADEAEISVEPTAEAIAAPVIETPVEAAAPEVAPVDEPVAAPVAEQPRRGRKPKVVTAPLAAAPAPVARKVRKPAAKIAVKAKAAPKPKKAAIKPARTSVQADPASAKPTVSQLKDKIMATKKTTDYAAAFTGGIAEAQEKAKAAFEKGSASLGEASEFAKGNVEAIVESGKILATGLKGLGEVLVAEGKTAYETMTADAKELAAVKTPADFFKLQGELLRRNFDSAVAFSSKSTEAMMKLAGDAAAPLSSRVSVAMDKVKKAA